jgi:hypothetical protein
MDSTDKTTNHATALAGAGILFLGLAGAFLWRDLALPRELVLSVAALLAGGATVARWPRRWPALGPVGLLLTTAAAACWFTLEKQTSLLPPLGIAAVTAIAAVLRGDGDGRELGHRLTWYALGGAVLAASWALYFQLFTVGFAADLVGRRLVLTLAWLAVGLGFFLGGRGRAAAMAHVGLAFIGCAMAKAAFYDTTHLQGPLRIAALAAVGLLLVVGGVALRRPAVVPGREVV